ncbi:MAG TPA: glycosyltransferase, partial [Gemmatales bacterium]|nr:glycosyltransferase [Gemmatales bacterium]
ITSILQQSLTELELIIIEAASDISISQLLHALQDHRILHLSYPRSPSLVGQLNYGLTQAKAALVARMDGDDWSYPDRLLKQYLFLNDHPEITVAGCQLQIIDHRDCPLGYRKYPTDPIQTSRWLRRFNTLAHPGVMYRKQAILDAGGYIYDKYPANEDYELWCRLAQKGYQLTSLDETLLQYRLHPHSMKSEKLKRILRGTRQVKRHYFAETMTLGDWTRYYGEGVLLNLPGWMILKLFKIMNYRQESSS